MKKQSIRIKIAACPPLKKDPDGDEREHHRVRAKCRGGDAPASDALFTELGTDETRFFVAINCCGHAPLIRPPATFSPQAGRRSSSSLALRSREKELEFPRAAKAGEGARVPSRCEAGEGVRVPSPCEAGRSSSS